MMAGLEIEVVLSEKDILRMIRDWMEYYLLYECEDIECITVMVFIVNIGSAFIVVLECPRLPLKFGRGTRCDHECTYE